MQSNNDIPLSKILYPMSFNSEYVKAYYGLNNELKSLIDTSGYKNHFLVKYNKALSFLEKLKKNCTEHKKLFEQLIKEDNLYSMMLFGTKNIRIIFYFTVIDEKEVAVLLNCFEEKRTSDYVKAIKIAHKIKNEIEKWVL